MVELLSIYSFLCYYLAFKYDQLSMQLMIDTNHFLSRLCLSELQVFHRHVTTLPTRRPVFWTGVIVRLPNGLWLPVSRLDILHSSFSAHCAPCSNHHKKSLHLPEWHQYAVPRRLQRSSGVADVRPKPECAYRDSGWCI